MISFTLKLVYISTTYIARTSPLKKPFSSLFLCFFFFSGVNTMRRYSNSSYSSSSYSSSSYSSSTSNISRGVSIYETELRSNAVAPEELFEALVLNGHSLIPMLAPHAVQCGEILEGDGGVGTIKMLTYAPG